VYAENDKNKKGFDYSRIAGPALGQNNRRAMCNRVEHLALATTADFANLNTHTDNGVGTHACRSSP